MCVPCPSLCTLAADGYPYTLWPPTIAICPSTQVHDKHSIFRMFFRPSLFFLSVGSSFDPGDHAFASYGPVSNDDLLQYYGFVERDNPSDAYVLEDMGKWLREVCLVRYPCDSTSRDFFPR